MLAENWCGDVPPQLAPDRPHRRGDAGGRAARVPPRSERGPARHLHYNNGFQSIPVVVFFDKDWNEIGRWLERHTRDYRGLRDPRRTLGAVPQGASKEQQDAAMTSFRARSRPSTTSRVGRSGAPRPPRSSSCWRRSWGQEVVGGILVRPRRPR